MDIEARFAIGTEYMRSGTHPIICKITDIHKTYNHAGDLVRLRYVSEHLFCGQKVTESDICDTTIARGIFRLEEHQAKRA